MYLQDSERMYIAQGQQILILKASKMNAAGS
jgi:hypothetical protein